MEKRSFKVILLIFASHDAPIYKFFRRIYQQYLDRHPEVKVFFVYGSSGSSLERQPYDLVYSDVKETVMTPHATTKVGRAMEYIDTNYDYEFLVRTNLSTFWDFERLVKRLDQFPKTRCLAGHLSVFKPHYITGIAKVLSRDVVKQIVAHQSDINISYPKFMAEDYLFSTFVTGNNHGTLIDASRYTRKFEGYKTFDPVKLAHDLSIARQGYVDNYRIKSIHGDRLEIDTRVATTLLKTIYDIDMQPTVEV